MVVPAGIDAVTIKFLFLPFHTLLTVKRLLEKKNKSEKVGSDTQVVQPPAEIGLYSFGLSFILTTKLVNDVYGSHPVRLCVCMTHLSVLPASQALNGGHPSITLGVLPLLKDSAAGASRQSGFSLFTDELQRTPIEHPLLATRRQRWSTSNKVM